MPVNEELKGTGKFELMDLHVDEAEHSMEMHLPYLVKVFQGYDFGESQLRVFFFLIILLLANILKKPIQVFSEDCAHFGRCS